MTPAPLTKAERVEDGYSGWTRDLNFHKVGQLLRDERQRQFEKWGDKDHDDRVWLMVLMEEVGEVARALNKTEGEERLREELVQTAAVAVAWLERLNDRAAELARLRRER